MTGTTPLLKPFRFCPQCGSERFVDNNAQSKRCLDCGLTYYINPKAAVVALITNEQGDILVCRARQRAGAGNSRPPGRLYRPRRDGRRSRCPRSAGRNLTHRYRDPIPLLPAQPLYLRRSRRTHDGSLFRVSCSRYQWAFCPRRCSLRTLHSPPENIARAVRSRIDSPGHNPHTGRKLVEKSLRNTGINNNPEIRVPGEIPNGKTGDTVHIPD